MNAKQRRTAYRKILTEARSLGLRPPSWTGEIRLRQLISEERNRRARAEKKAPRDAGHNS